LSLCVPCTDAGSCGCIAPFIRNLRPRWKRAASYTLRLLCRRYKLETSLCAPENRSQEISLLFMLGIEERFLDCPACSLVTIPTMLHRLCCRGQLKCDGTRTETRFRLSAKQTSPFKSVGTSVQSTTGSRGVRINGSNAGYTMFRGIVKGTGYPLLSTVSLSLPLPCVTVCHHISTGPFL